MIIKCRELTKYPMKLKDGGTISFSTDERDKIIKKKLVFNYKSYQNPSFSYWYIWRIEKFVHIKIEKLLNYKNTQICSIKFADAA